MQTFKQKSPRTLRREQERKLRKQYKTRVVIPANESFTRIKPDLLRMGWIFEEDFGNLVDFGNSSSLTFSPAVRLVTEKFNVTIIPRKNGVEISRLEVWENFQGQGYASLFLDNLLRFLMKMGVSDIYVLPLPAGIGKSKNSLAFNAPALQSFYRKRGFQKISNELYWKLEEWSNIDIKKLDMEILSKLIPSANVAPHGIEIHFEFVGCNRQNSVYRCPYETNAEFIAFLLLYLCLPGTEIKDYDMSTKALYCFLNAYKKREQLGEVTMLVQNMFGILLAEAIDIEEDNQEILALLSTAMIGVMHLGNDGVKKGVKAYRLVFDQINRTMDTATSTEYHLKD